MPVKIQEPEPCRQDKALREFNRGELFRFTNTFRAVPIVYMVMDCDNYKKSGYRSYTPINSDEKSGLLFLSSNERKVIPVKVTAKSEDIYA